MVKGFGYVLLATLVVGGSGCLEPNPDHAGFDAGNTAAGSEATTTDTTGGDGGAGSGMGSSGVSAGDSEDGGGPDTMVLRNFDDPERCVEPLWCADGDDLFDPLPADVWGQECFRSPWAQFEVVEANYWLAAVDPALDDYDIELREYDTTTQRPGSLIDVWTEPVGAFAPGERSIALETLVTTANFCVGFAAVSNPEAALGMAVDPSSDVGDVSFLRLNGPDACAVPAYEDVIDLQPTPAGNWCIEVRVRRVGP